MSGADEESSDVIMVSDLRPLRIVLLESVAADVALCCVLVFLSLLSAHSLHRSIGSELLEDCRFTLHKDVQELGERIFFNLNHFQLIVIAEIRAKNGCRGAHFVLLRVSCLLNLAAERLFYGLEVCIDHERRHSTELVIVKLQLRMLGAWHWKHMEN